MQELWLAGIKDPALLTSPCFFCFFFCWRFLTADSQSISKPVFKSLFEDRHANLPVLPCCCQICPPALCFHTCQGPIWPVALSPVSVLFVTSIMQKKKLLKWFLLGDGWRRERGKKEPMKPLELHVNKRWCVEIFWVSLYILKWSLFSSFLIYLPGNYGWSSFAFIQVLF